MVRPTDQALMAIEKIVCHSQFSGGGGMSCPIGPLGEEPGLFRRQK